MPGTAPRGPLRQRYEYRLLNYVPCSPHWPSANSTMPAPNDPPRRRRRGSKETIRMYRRFESSKVLPFRGCSTFINRRQPWVSQQDDQSRASLLLRSFWYF